MTTQLRRRAQGFGRWGESLCACRLRLCGWRIVARNFRTPWGEIDVAARRGSVLAIIEVKSRLDPASAVEAVTPRQRQRIAAAALRLLQSQPALAGLDLRFDVMVVGRRRWPSHIVDAWRPET